MVQVQKLAMDRLLQEVQFWSLFVASCPSLLLFTLKNVNLWKVETLVPLEHSIVQVDDKVDHTTVATWYNSSTGCGWYRWRLWICPTSTILRIDFMDYLSQLLVANFCQSTTFFKVITTGTILLTE